MLTTSRFKLEHRAAVEVRVEGRALHGYAAVYDAEARVGGFTETIARGAFRETLARGGDTLALLDHDVTKVLARTRAGSLDLREDDRGLVFSMTVPNTSAGNDALELVRSGNAGGMSFAFVPVDEQWEGRRRTLRSVDLKEISVVSAHPAYPSTEVSVRTLQPRRARLARYLETV